MPNICTQHFSRFRLLLGSSFRSCFVFLLLAGSVLVVGCGGDSSQQSDGSAPPAADSARRAKADTVSQGNEKKKEPVEGLCIYQGAPVRTAPGGEAEYVTNLNVGESLTFLNETKMAKRGDQQKEYSKVRLKGGDKGWVRSDMIATGADPAAVLRKTILHERPTPMASTEKTFRAMDVVAVLDTQDTWIKVRGVRRGQQWWDTGWVRPNALTKEMSDVTVAALWKKARTKEDSTEKRKALKRITTNPSLEGSVFVDSLRARLDTSGTS